MKKNRDIRRAERFLVEDSDAYSGHGVFYADTWSGSVMWGRNEHGFEHVSVSPFIESVTPSWDDMCKLKDVFFDDDEEVVQIHPAKGHYVNLKDNCLHLWKPIHEDKERVLATDVLNLLANPGALDGKKDTEKIAIVMNCADARLLCQLVDEERLRMQVERSGGA